VPSTPANLPRKGSTGVQLAPGAERSLRGLYSQPASRGLGIGQNPYDDGGFSGATWSAASTPARRHPGSRIDIMSSTRSTGSPARSPICPAGRDLRCAGCFVRVGHPAIQYHELDGTADPPMCCCPLPIQREVTGERIRDKMPIEEFKGMWMGGIVAAGLRREPAHARHYPARPNRRAGSSPFYP